jgi:hypothetical protein
MMQDIASLMSSQKLHSTLLDLLVTHMAGARTSGATMNSRL